MGAAIGACPAGVRVDAHSGQWLEEVLVPRLAQKRANLGHQAEAISVQWQILFSSRNRLRDFAKQRYEGISCCLSGREHHDSRDALDGTNSPTKPCTN